VEVVEEGEPMRSGSEAGSYLRRIDFVYHSTLGLRVIKNKIRVLRKVEVIEEGDHPKVGQEMCSGSEAGSYLRLIDSCITQLKAQGPSMTCNESKEEEEEEEEGLTEGSSHRGRRPFECWPERRPACGCGG